MKVKLLLVAFILIISTHKLSYSQVLNNNLKNLDRVSIQVIDEGGLLSGKIYQKLTTELKLKIMSAGMKVLSPEESSAKMFIVVDAIKSLLGTQKILVLINIQEKVNTHRKNSTEANAMTYFDYSLFSDANIEKAVYDKVMDTMIINFIEKYLSQNKA